MKEINSVIKDLKMLKKGTWVPDEDSCDASIEMLERAKEEIYKFLRQRYNEKTIIDLIQFLSINKDFNSYSSVSVKTAKRFFKEFKNQL
jgi:hypothetical protein